MSIIREIRHQVNSFGPAAKGIRLMLADRNAWLHGLGTGVVIGAGWWLNVSWESWRWLALAIAVMWITETLNTAIERLCDLAQPSFHPLAKVVKDLAAGAVLFALLFAIFIGGSVLGPPLWQLAAPLLSPTH